MKIKLIMFISVLFIAAIFSSCQFPKSEVDAAVIAVDSAKLVGADFYVPEAYNALVDSLASANKKLETDKLKGVTTFNKSKKAMVNVTEMALETIKKSLKVKSKIEDETYMLIDDVNVLINKNKVLLDSTIKGENEIALNKIKSKLVSIELIVIETQKLLVTDVIEANKKLIVAKEQVTEINMELTKIIEK